MHGIASLLGQYGAAVSKLVPSPAKTRILGNEALNLSSLLGRGHLCVTRGPFSLVCFFVLVIDDAFFSGQLTQALFLDCELGAEKRMFVEF